ncbi:hypothetical protein GCK72_020875 [Caenorhabditis remanei]|uniref:Mos1 transposase HTH domain-containing protein n=1 Tax=Caenorhabditis remanei TaxID=31234 RepID=A0A6A5GID0_CAERE|nr:hypothetical protein GCK72_020875 [Caenorhabditis remanei]KAF1754315.1 hypothetical protein GCK72_020875 [Caenorhabditis remanei]
MTTAPRADPEFQRSSILYEFLRGKSEFDSYLSFCEVMGEDTKGYREFDYWFTRFSNGNFGLVDEENAVRSIRYLMDLPVEIIGRIVDFVTWKDV